MKALRLLLLLVPSLALGSDEIQSLANQYFRLSDGIERLLFLEELERVQDLSLRVAVEAEIQKRGPEVLEQLEKKDLERLNRIREDVVDSIAKQSIDESLKAVRNQMKERHKTCNEIGSNTIFDLSNAKASRIKFEDPKECQKQMPTKVFFQNSIKASLSPQDFEENPHAELPLECVQAVMKNFPSNPNYYVGCEVDTNKCPNKKCEVTAKGFGRPCMTKEYSHRIFNDFVDVASCLGISQKEMLPKYFQESGMHLNVRGGGGDIGIGQLTGPAVTTVNDSHNTQKPFDFWNRTKDLVLRSDKPACKKIAGRVKNFAPTESTRSCEFVSPPDGPMKNLYYSMINTIRNRSYVSGSRRNQGVAELEKNTALVKYQEKIDKMLVLLAYNAGASTAVVRYATYLQGLQRGKVNLSNESEVKKRFAFSKHDMSRPRAPLVGLTCSDVGVKVQVADLTFPEYLGLCQGEGARGYLSRMAEKKAQLDKELGEICTEKQFLDL